MAELAFVMGQGGTAVRHGLSVGFVVMLLLILFFVWDLSRRIRRWFGRSLKARQDLARATADVAERLERIEGKLEDLTKGER